MKGRHEPKLVRFVSGGPSGADYMRGQAASARVRALQVVPLLAVCGLVLSCVYLEPAKRDGSVALLSSPLPISLHSSPGAQR